MTPVPVPTTLHATSLCDGLPVPADLVVRSVHRSAMNLVARDGTLVTLADARGGGLPGGILVGGTGGGDDGDDEGFDFHAAALAPGVSAALTATTLDVGDGRLAVRLEGARRWSPRIARLDPTTWAWRGPATHAGARAAMAPGNVTTLPGVRTTLDELRGALATGDRAAGTAAMRRLVGLGPGLTPSGDDTLTGLAAALYAVGHPAATWLTGALDDLDARTTFVAAAMLRHAARGEVAERTHRLLAALLAPGGGAGDDVPAAIRATVAWGATSGSDLLVGVLLGLDAATGVRRTEAA